MMNSVKIFKSSWLTLALTAFSLLMLFRYIHLFESAAGSEAHTLALIVWSVAAIIGMTAIVCQVFARYK